MNATPNSASEIRKRGRTARTLHRLYFIGAGVHHFIFRRVRPAGIGVTIVLILATFMALGHTRVSVYQLFSLSLGMVLIGMTWALFRRASLEGKRELPRYGTCGETLRYAVCLRHLGKQTLYRAWLEDTPPDPRPNLEDFSKLREPGEEERNWFDRHLPYFRWRWLYLRNRMFTGGTGMENLSLRKSEERRTFIELTPLRRGVIQFNDLRVLLPDPFGLFQRCRKVKCPPSTLMVLPRRYQLPPIDLAGGAAFKITGEANTNSIGTSGEFVGLRDYRPGDPLRQIHWKSWARTGRPIVKELEDTYYPRYGLILDTLSDGKSDGQFEEAVSVAASFAASIDTDESLLDLMFVKGEAHAVTAGRSVERAEKLLEVLAGITPERTANYDSLVRLVASHADDLTSCLVVLSGWDEARAEFLQKIRRHGIICAPLIIGIGPAPADIPGHWIESGNLSRDLQRLPRVLNTST